jgi:acetoin utilization deacetylase AcuC-like enzyme
MINPPAPELPSPASSRNIVDVIIATDPLCVRHDPGPGHPEQPARFTAAQKALEQAGLLHPSALVTPPPASMEDLERVHSPEYLALAQSQILAGRPRLSTGDTAVCIESWKAAQRAAGCAIAATEAVLQGRSQTAFALIRPPGHHAGRANGMGFCVLNNVAIAARFAQHRFGIQRILIVDWDVHHGNGTQDLFYEDGSVFFFSTHQSPLYPGTGKASETGRGQGAGTTLNCPLPAGSARAEVFDAFESKLLPAMERFQPELILLSAGFDSRKGDPLGGFELTDADFSDLTHMMRSLAEKTGQGRVVSFLEGGYNLPGLASAVTAHVKALQD